MPIVSSGQVSLGAIATEFGGSAPHQLSEYHGKGNAPSSGEIQLAADFYGTANTYDIQYLIVAGGGGAPGSRGSGYGTGAGGAGGYRQFNTATTLTAGSAGMTVTVGAGGNGNGIPWYGGNGASNGSNSSFNGNSSTGGGGGGGLRNGNSGGSGGGGGWRVQRFNSGAYAAGGGNAGGYTPPEGTAASNGYATTNFHPNYKTQYGRGGEGGELSSSDRTWLNGVSYAARGTISGSGYSGTANTGNGAGTPTEFTYADVNRIGGSGVVIIRYQGAQRGSGGTVTSSGGYTYHQFNSSGTYNP
tara:strand:- start:5252 stop:6154 length:903 start_codon:yes stop_codon:yes gene_type:complete